MADVEDLTGGNNDGMRSLATSCIKDRVEEEKCVVAQYRTSTEQKQSFESLMSTCPKNNIPIEWVIDIADESNGWFYGTAYHFDDTTQMLHVMVPDKENPSFDGQVLLDHRTVHLIECVDGQSDALFNKIVRDSVIKVKWDVEWFEESEDGQGESQSWAQDGTMGSWIVSSARYYIRIANQLLVEDKDMGQDARGFVIITADLNLKLLKCHKSKGVEDFQRLVNEGLVQSSTEASEYAKNLASPTGTPAAPAHHGGGDGTGNHSSTSAAAVGGAKGAPGAEFPDSPLKGTALTPAGKLADMSTSLRECIGDLLDDRDRIKADNVQMAEMFQAFALSGDLDEGMKLFDKFSGIKDKADKQLAAQMSDMNLNPAEEEDDEDDKMEAVADDAVYLSQKLERNLGKIARSGGEVSTSAAEEIETLRRSLRKMRNDLQDRDDTIRQLSGKA
mmetsp:Transcript_10657/g.17939  ORF Transcript_10657/g.17939 Transcript_10657/m.17939 type:complete len:446 (-) Transcript_10657:252-1589(-)